MAIIIIEIRASNRNKKSPDNNQNNINQKEIRIGETKKSRKYKAIRINIYRQI